MPREPGIYRGPCFLRDMLFSVRTASGNLSRDKRRTLLSILGVFLGALLLTAVVHVLGGIARGIEEKAVQLGVGTITVTPERPLFSRENDGIQSFSRNERGVGAGKDAAAPPQLAGTITSAATLKLSDLAAILREFPAVAKGVPFVLQKGQVFLRGSLVNLPAVRHYRRLSGKPQLLRRGWTFFHPGGGAETCAGLRPGQCPCLAFARQAGKCRGKAHPDRV